MIIQIISLVITLIILALVFIVLRRGGSVPEMIDFRSDFERLEKLIRDEVARNRQELNDTIRQFREETTKTINLLNDSLLSRVADNLTAQKNQLDTFSSQLMNLTQVNEQKLEKIRTSLEERLKILQDENGKKLDEMRATVDEKLHVTLEKRLGESFKFVSDRLDLVHKGLGEMQALAVGVGDLKKVLTNVKTRGIWGEIQLGNILEQVLSPQQYETNVATKKGSADRVEFAVKMPGHDKESIWLPIDAKFPLEDYQKLVEAQDKVDVVLVETLAKALEMRIKAEAKDIKEKYIDPPNTTDFGILFLPVEGLYAEVLRRPGLADTLQNQFRVVVTGPTTIVALLNSLQMGFRTLAIEKRAGEVWTMLSVVKTEFGNFGELLDKTHKKLQEASNTIEDAARKSRTIEKKLKNVQELPAAQPIDLIDKE